MLDEVINAIPALAGATASGGLLGLVGSIIGGVFKRFDARDELTRMRASWEHELNLLGAEAMRAQSEVENETRLEHVRGSYRGLDSSVAADAAGIAGTSQWVKNFRSMFRPTLTILLVVADIAIIAAVLSGSVPTEKLSHSLIANGVDTLHFLAVTATCWWFGERAMTPRRAK